MIETARSAVPTARPDEGTVQGVAESRLDPITGDWTIFAPERDKRPDEFKVTQVVTSQSETCPFCQGHESETPDPVWIGRVCDDQVQVDCEPSAPIPGDQSCWAVRVVPNKFPAVTSLPAGGSATHAADRDTGVFQSRPIGGGHEVIVESPNHLESLSELDLSEAALVFRAYQDRIRFWRNDPSVRYISIFKNVGAEAGASLRHAHSQLIALDRRPKMVSSVIDRVRLHQAKTGCCLQCDLVRAEQKSKTRIVAQTESLIAYCPFASRLPMLVRITTKEHQAHFEDLAPTIVEEVSRLSVRVVSWLEKLHPGVAYNHLLQTCPPGDSDAADAFHWSMDLFPRLTRVAGFEWGSQCMINPVLPESAAARYRLMASAEDPRMVL